LGPHADRVYDVRFHVAPLREVLQFLTWLSGINVVIPEGIEGVVSVDFRQIRLGDALSSIIKANDLDYTIEGNVIRVGLEKEFIETGENLKTETFRLRFATAVNLLDKVRELLSENGSVIADERTNSLLVRELPGNIDSVRRFIQDIDIKDAQVLIEAKIMEVSKKFVRSLGIQWGVNRNRGLVRPVGLNDVGQFDTGRNLNVNLGALNPTSGIGLLIGTVNGVDIDVAISAAEEEGELVVISDPSIVTSNGKPARIRSGTTFYIKTVGDVNIGTPGGTQTTAGGSGLHEVQTGVELEVTPQITTGNYVKMGIETTTSQPDFSKTVEGIPVIIDNIAKTTVLVKDGETTIIGGLTRMNDGLNKGKVPFLAKIPLFGNLFKNRSRQRENSELMVFITPRVVRDEGILPAQIRVREMEERQASMKMDNILKTDAQKAKEKAELEERMQVRRSATKGNKYVR
jgi:type IV pilus assembly protein PilQ